MPVGLRACSIQQFQHDLSDCCRTRIRSAFVAIPRRALPAHGEAATTSKTQACFSQDLRLEFGHVRIVLNRNVGGACDTMFGHRCRNHVRQNGQLLLIILKTCTWPPGTLSWLHGGLLACSYIAFASDIPTVLASAVPQAAQLFLFPRLGRRGSSLSRKYPPQPSCFGPETAMGVYIRPR